MTSWLIAATLLLMVGVSVLPVQWHLRRHMQHARRREEYFRLVVENGFDLLTIVDAKGVVTYSTPAQKRFTGYEEQEEVGLSAFTFIHPDDVERVNGVLQEIVIVPDRPVTTRFRVVTKNGQLRYVECVGRNLLHHPSISGIVVNARDITRQREAECQLEAYQEGLERRVRERTAELQAANERLEEEVMRREVVESELRERELLYRMLFERVSEPILVKELDDASPSRFEEANEAASRMLGFSVEELLERTPADILVGGLEAYRRLRKPLRLDEPLSFETKFKRKDGSTIPVDGTVNPVEAGDRRMVVIMARDATERLAAEREMRRDKRRLRQKVRDRTRELEKRTALLEAANRDLEAFSYSVSHDLRAPIRSLNGFSTMLRDHLSDGVDAKTAHYLDRIEANAEKMRRLVDDLLLFSRVGKQALQVMAVDVEQVVFEVLNELAVETERPQVSIDVQPMPPIRGDELLIRQVYQNLLSNALKFSRPRTRTEITVGSNEGDAGVTYFVRDNGVGFDPKYADRLFGVFQRLHSDEEFEGTGAGLAIVERIIRKHGGEVWAESRPDAGAVFYFTIGTPCLSSHRDTPQESS